jgi:UDP-N-acetylmuramoyl-tripeptide--D-alanyl-D-alanine ligase
MNKKLNNILEFVKAVGGKLHSSLENSPLINTPILGISTNSKEIKENEIFIPLIGDKFDAHSFISGALEHSMGSLFNKGNKNIENISSDKYLIEVDDTLKSLQLLGKNNRLLNENMKVIGVTGSNGKTTTKEIIGAILFKLSEDVFISKKNLNNHIGVPLNLIELTDNIKYSVFEMGASAVGEIDLLASLVLPDISIITNVAPAHLEGFKTIENILKTKTEIFKHTKNVKIINYDNQYLKEYADENKDVIKFGFESGSDLQIIELITRETHKVIFKYKNKRYSFESVLPGVHNIYNLLGALLAIEALGFDMQELVDIIDGLNIEISGRLRKIEYNNHVIYDDSYNSNPLSVRAGVEYFYNDSKKIDNTLADSGEIQKILILGEMKELGEHSRFYHEDIGSFLNNYRFDNIFLIGEETKFILKKLDFGISVKWFSSLDELVIATNDLLKSNERKMLYIKGSRGNKLDEIIKGIER